MALETGTYISDLNASNPVGATDKVSTLDDHVRLLKSTIQATFPNIAGAVTPTHSELNVLDGITASTAELNILDGVTATASELNTLDGITATVSELNILDGVTASAAELNLLDGITGTVWSSGNDGAGSGLDADTLDGVQGSDYARLSQSNVFTHAINRFADDGTTGYVQLVGGDAGKPGFVAFHTSDDTRRGYLGYDVSSQIQFVAENGYGLNIVVAGGSMLTFDGSTGAASFGSSCAVRAPTIAGSTSTTLAAGQVHAIDGNATLPNMAAGQWVTVINNGSSARTVTKNGSDTMYWTATGSSVTSVTIPARGRASFVCADGTNVYASGNITGSS